MNIAILIDGGFFLKRYSKVVEGEEKHDAQQVANTMYQKLTQCFTQADENQLYRLFFYDCPPLAKRAHNPVSNRSIVFENTEPK